MSHEQSAFSTFDKKVVDIFVWGSQIYIFMGLSDLHVCVKCSELQVTSPL